MPILRSTLAACLATGLTLSGPTVALTAAAAVTILSAPPAAAKSDKAQSDRGQSDKAKSDRASGGRDSATRGGGKTKVRAQSARAGGGRDGASRGGSKAANWMNARAEKAGSAIEGTLGRLTGRDKAQARKEARRTTTQTATQSVALAPEASIAPEARKKPKGGAIKAMHAINASPQAFKNASDNSRVGRIRTWAVAYYAAEDGRAGYEAERAALYDAAYADLTPDQRIAVEAGLAGLNPDSETYAADYDAALLAALPDWTDDQRGALRDGILAADETAAARDAELSDLDLAAAEALAAAAGPNAAPEGEDLDWVIERMPSRETLGLMSPDDDAIGDAPVADPVDGDLATDVGDDLGTDEEDGVPVGDDYADADLGTDPIEDGVLLIEE